ncbi:MAG: hypothetical protein ACFE9C_02670, partial [Candidatus Hodarchaeota archaeon]
EGVGMVANSREVDFFGAREGLAFHGAGGMHGGYPNATGYRLYAKNTNMKEIIQNRMDYPLGDPDPTTGEFEKLLKGEITRKPYCSIYPITLENYDLFYYFLSGGPGYGDPLEREIEQIKQDLDDGFYTEDIVKNVYGVIAKYNETKDEWEIDEKATKIRQKELMSERREKSMTFEEFWEKEKKKITENRVSEPVKLMFSESLKLSNNWAKIFKQFWKLPENFEMEVK